MTSPIAILSSSPEFAVKAQALAAHLQLPFISSLSAQHVTDAEFVLMFSEQGILLQQTGHKAPGPVYAEFTEGAVDHRRKFGGGKGQMIAKAVGVKAGVYPRVLDATAGLGKDSFVLATLGCEMYMLERSPIVFALLQDGLQRAKHFAAAENDMELLRVMQRMNLIAQDSRDYLQQLASKKLADAQMPGAQMPGAQMPGAQMPGAQMPDIIYLDPMFPDRQKTADVKKEMRVFHDVIGKDEDADELLPLALSCVNYRVVVKRPRKAPFLNQQTPSYQLEGKSSRYDIYTIKKLPEKLEHS